MNLCFLIGKVVSNIKFDFVINSKNISIVRFKLELENKSIINIRGYNDIADYCYKNLEKGNAIKILGKIDSNMEVVVKECKYI